MRYFNRQRIKRPKSGGARMCVLFGIRILPSWIVQFTLLKMWSKRVIFQSVWNYSIKMFDSEDTGQSSVQVIWLDIFFGSCTPLLQDSCWQNININNNKYTQKNSSSATSGCLSFFFPAGCFKLYFEQSEVECQHFALMCILSTYSLRPRYTVSTPPIIC